MANAKSQIPDPQSAICDLRFRAPARTCSSRVAPRSTGCHEFSSLESPDRQLDEVVSFAGPGERFDRLDDAPVDRIVSLAEGNPFYLEELGVEVRGEVVPTIDGQQRALALVEAFRTKLQGEYGRDNRA